MGRLALTLLLGIFWGISAKAEPWDYTQREHEVAYLSLASQCMWAKGLSRGLELPLNLEKVDTSTLAKEWYPVLLEECVPWANKQMDELIAKGGPK